jgi:hypothetical protein
MGFNGSEKGACVASDEAVKGIRPIADKTPVWVRKSFLFMQLFFGVSVV